ncbi:hypothetical protein [Bacillus cereus]|uniref:hypothetical protein n=1 Tax=Bacillus cereus TaxID=1396 RepID=UPI0038790460
MSDVYILQKFDKREFAKNEILVTSEAIEILGISRSRMNMLLKKGQLEPIKRTIGVNLFLRDDINEEEGRTHEETQAIRL